MKKYIQFISINENNIIDINLFPEDIKKALDQYDYNQHGFDWNEESRKHGRGMREWMINWANTEFSKNIDKLISDTQHDLRIKRLRELAKEEEDKYENYIRSQLTDNQIEEVTMDNIFNFAKIDRFVEENPEYKDMFDKWMELSNKYTDILVTDTKAFRPISYDSILKLNNFLKDLKKQSNFQTSIW
jgi:hypothetical protein